MSRISLSRKIEKALPDTIKVDGSAFKINPDFRNILRILRMLSDDSIMEAQRPMLLAKWFYSGDPPPDPVEPFSNFLAERVDGGGHGKSQQTEPPRRFDFEFDAEEIYTSFLEQYGINLLRTEYLHWHEFMALLAGLGENTAFQRKIHVRFLDTKGLKGDALAKAKRAKDAVQIPTRHSKEAIEAMRRIEDALMGNGDLTGVL